MTLVPGRHGFGPGVAQANRASLGLQRCKAEIDLDGDVLSPAERSSCGGLDDAHSFQRQTKGQRNQTPFFVDPLTRSLYCQSPAVVTRAARFEIQECMIDALGLNYVLDDDIRLIHCFRRIALPDVFFRQDVPLGMNLGRARLEGLLHGEDSRQGLVFHADLLDGFEGRSLGPPHGEGHGISQVAHPLAGENFLIAAD